MKTGRPLQKFKIACGISCWLHLALLAFCLCFFSHSSTLGTERKEEKRVLILFPNQSYVPAYPMVEKGIKSKLGEGTEFHIEDLIEFMDWYRNTDQTYRQLLLDIYRNKFSH